MFCAEHGIPQVCYAGIQAGSTAPMTFAGTVVQGNAETLACLVFNQLVKPGSAVIYGHFSTIMDMRSSIFSFGAPEMSLMVAAQSQIARHYNLPFMVRRVVPIRSYPIRRPQRKPFFRAFLPPWGAQALFTTRGYWNTEP